LQLFRDVVEKCNFLSVSVLNVSDRIFATMFGVTKLE